MIWVEESDIIDYIVNEFGEDAEIVKNKVWKLSNNSNEIAVL